MIQYIKLILLLLMICSYQPFFGQENPKVKDSALLYRKIEKYSKKSKFTHFIHKLIFEPIAKQKIKKNSFHKIKKNPYSSLEGKIIREINIKTNDPFGYSEIDTTLKPTTFLHRTGNSWHLKTKNLAIRNLLLIKRDQPLDSLLVKESERIIRRQNYIRSVSIVTQLISKNSDSVDVFVRIIDSWSIIPDFSTSSSKSNFSLRDRNFFGFGHEFSSTYIESLTGNNRGFRTSYTIPTLMNTFIKTQVSYEIDLDGNYSKFIAIERPFYSVYARWAAGINLDQQLTHPTVIDANQNLQLETLKYNSQDFWAGHSYQIFKGSSEYNRGTNLITTARFYNKTFVEKPILNQDSLGIYSNEKLYLIGLGISSRKYTQDKYIFNFNLVEDVASGFVYSITSGYQRKNDNYKFYAGAKIGLGNYFEFGYLSGSIEYGAFYKNGKTVQSATNLKLIYFTNLIETGTWKFRQFIKPQLVIGNNRINSTSDQLTLNEGNGIQGFNSELLYGTKKLLITFQMQGYSPWRIIGFRLNPYLSYSMGMLGKQDVGFQRSKVYSQIGLGIIVSNDYLIFNSFQFSFSYYPTVPIDISSNFKTNAFHTGDFGLQDFEISKPNLVNYN
jgi:hypothetical protein